MYLFKSYAFSEFQIYKLKSKFNNHYVEDECTSPNKFQKVFFTLPASGPDSVGELRPNRFGTYSRTGRNCLIKLVPPSGYGIIITVLKVDFRNHDGCKDFFKIYDNGEDEDGDRLCGFRELGVNGKTYFSDADLKLCITHRKVEWASAMDSGLYLLSQN
ncbi:CUB domain-containing protein [Caerostris extrusa]|uniref:CUB domain-containing protein n=1 Tax=Caerostris extrusa TaxID=172846 RepID=A0AAV4S4S0_CAEEX|nr:CUB domain-containing protein [Caerostris extrusa]